MYMVQLCQATTTRKPQRNDRLRSKNQSQILFAQTYHIYM